VDGIETIDGHYDVPDAPEVHHPKVLSYRAVTLEHATSVAPERTRWPD
jgi:hypothetical protein